MRHRVRVIPARARGFGREAIAAMAVSGDVGRSFFHRSVYRRGNQLPMPVHGLGDVRVVEHVYGDGFSFSESQDRAGRGAVITYCLYDFSWFDIDVYWIGSVRTCR